MTTPPFDPPSADDIAVVSAQLGRPARDVIGIAARCICGNPTVVSTKPRLTDGTPFPTLYYLSHPAATAAISTLEANGVMPELAELIDERYLAAHLSYIADRESIEFVEEIAGISAGGMPTRVKCLHALAAHALAAGPGVNPIGDLALEQAAWSPLVCECAG
ncbi:MAG: septum formation initiator family protein [Microbacteriaceae bacterium]|nr:septum formation initiator family protein [Microbacteriaceae bacterium]